MCKKYVFFLICCLLFTAKSTSASDVNITSNSETDIIGDTDMSADKENLPELINYTFYIDAPETFPVELFYADFLLDKPNYITYSYRKIFVDHHNDNSTTIRVENEKPFPHSVDMVWYSITENKAYSLIQELPYDMLKEQIKNYDAILLSLTPYGQVNLYSYNVFTEKKDWIGLYHAKEINLELADFRKSGALYENPEMPVKNWQEYQLNALAYFSKAAVFMHENDYIMPPKDFDFWQKNYIKEPVMPSLDAINKLDENGETPLINAVRTQNTALVVRLIVAGADLNIQSKNSGETALSAACSMNHLQYAKYLIMKGADLNLPEAQSGETPLMLASLAGHDKIVELLIKSGADVNARQFMYGQDIGYNALKYAKENNNQKIVEMLLQAGAEEISENTDNIKTETIPATTISNAVMLGDISQVEKLLAEGANPNEQIVGMGSLLYYAVATGNVDVVNALIKAKADVNAVAVNGYTPLMTAITTGQTDVVKALLSHADRNKATSDGYTPLMIAAMNGQKEIVKLLLEAGVNINAVNLDGNTPLMIAISANQIETAKVIINAGPDFSIKNKLGETALTIAQNLDDKQIASIIQAFLWVKYLNSTN